MVVVAFVVVIPVVAAAAAAVKLAIGYCKISKSHQLHYILSIKHKLP